MCGFVGFYTRTKIPALKLEEMAHSIAHRGPDDEGFFGVSDTFEQKSWKRGGTNPGDLILGMGFRRLAIIDLSSDGAQPMASQDGRYRITFNGEIYNYLELKKDLAGFSFRSKSDTEVLLELFAKFQDRTLAKLNGIFAFSLFDRETRKLWLVRDHFGIKPLYYFQDERGIFYASEIRALLVAKREKPTLDRTLISRYLMNGWIPDPDTLFEGIKKLEPGHFLCVNPDITVRDHAYWDLNFAPSPTLTKDDWMSELDVVLSRSVERQLRSDVPVAFFLSGGVDSSLLAARAIAVQKEIPTTFTIGFKWANSKDDDLDLESARIMAKEFKFKHNEILLEPDVVSLLPKIVSTLEEPISDAAALCSYLICEAAASKFKVLISGQGGDELFGGYPVYRSGLATRWGQRFPNPVTSVLFSASRHIPYSLGSMRSQNVHRAKKMLQAMQSPWPTSFSLLRSPMSLEQLNDLLSKDLKGSQQTPFGAQEKLFRHAETYDPLHQELYIDTKTYLPCLNLTYTDKTSMAHSVEVRVPLLDMEIASLVQRLPSRWKMNLNESKVLLKAVADRYLPRPIVHRKKAGFGLPLKDWFLKDLQPMANDLLSEARLRKQGFFDPKVVQTFLEEHRDRVADHSTKLYSLMTFQLWCDTYGI